MLSNFEEILTAALSLPPDARAMLYFKASTVRIKNRSMLPGAEEIERRIREIDESKVETIDGELVMRELRFRRRR